ncbi:MAG: hypothetical protein GY928_34120 [Colwellia sp.]|nr:hypothetical protein [Colwellia sp.]
MQTSLEYLTDLWQPAFTDNLDTINNWTATSGSWGNVDGKLQAFSGVVDGTTDNAIYHEYTVESPPFRWRIGLSSASLSEDRLVRISLTTPAGPAEFSLEISHTANVHGHKFKLNYNGLTDSYEIFRTTHIAPEDSFLIIDIWVLENSTIEVWLNGIQQMIQPSSHSLSGTYRFLLEAENGQQFENAMRWIREEHLSLNLNSIRSGNATDDTFHKDTHQSALSFLYDRFFLESRLNYSTSGLQELEVGDFVGENKSNYIIFERRDGKGNIKQLESPSSSQQLATAINFFGQGQHSNQTVSEAFDFEAMDLYGVIEHRIADSKVTVPSTARQKAESVLEVKSSGVVSMTATLVEKSHTRNRWDVGDIIQVIDESQGVNRPARVIKIQHTEGKPERAVVFDRLPYSKRDEMARQRDQISDIYRLTRGSTAKEVFSIPRQSLWVDCYDKEFRYVNDASAVSVPVITFWQSISGGAGIGAFECTLQFVNINESFVSLSFYSSSIKIFARRDTNMADMQIDIDGSTVATTSLNGSRQDRFEVYDASYALDSKFHYMKLSRSGVSDLNLFMNLDAIRLGGWYKRIFIEARAVNAAKIEWAISDQNVYVRVIIDNIDRTAALGGGISGFQGNQEIDALQFLSQPGNHSIELINDDSGLEDLYLEATITVTGLV